MSMNDPIGDMLTRIRNSQLRGSISPIGSFIDIVRSPYQLDLTMPGI